jgi:hypothetical protein
MAEFIPMIERVIVLSGRALDHRADPPGRASQEAVPG